MTAKVPLMLLMLSIFPLLGSVLTTMLSTNYIILWEISIMNSSSMEMSLFLDWMGLFYSFIVLFISSNVMKFSKLYMSDEIYNKRFTFIVLLFILSMNLLIYIPNILALLIGWDGLGITSFILVIFYNNMRSLVGGLLTALTNRLGDIFLLASIIMYMNMGTWHPQEMINNPVTHTMTACLILLACMTKSAQLPFSTWLPAAMAAPTPVSALVHSSTLVTAGVFILIRFHSVFMSNLLTSHILMISSLLTCILSSLVALLETDMKKIIALSTLSQLGFMMLSISLNMPKLAFFHMSVHAMFKALLFITAGNLIHFNYHNQDSRLFGNFTMSTPLNTSSMFISSASMMGLPFMSGYYSKHVIMDLSPTLTNYLIMTMIIISITLTSLYSLKLIYMTTIETPTSTSQQLMLNSNSDVPILVMSTMSVIMGISLSWTLLPNMTIVNITPQALSLFTNMMLILALILFIISFMCKLNYIHVKKYSKSVSDTLTSFLYLNFITSMFHYKYWNTSINLNKINDHSWIEFLYSYKPLYMLGYSTSKIESNMNVNPMRILHLAWLTPIVFIISAFILD